MLNHKLFLQFLILLGISALYVQGCDRLSVEKDLEGVDYTLLDQDSTVVTFPDNYTGKVMLVGYVYTNCPDICPMITYNMRDVQERMGDHEDFLLISVSFDPERDTPNILSRYAKNFKLNEENWRLLTGDSQEVRSLLEKLEVTTVKTPTRFSENNDPIYFIDHTDKVSLIDKEGKVRQSYFGSELDSEEVIEDIQTLLKDT